MSYAGGLWSNFMSFDTLGLSAELLRAISDKGYKTPTPIQLQAIPSILKGLDIMGGAQTGTGKTAGFTLPLLEKLKKYANSKNNHKVRALILTPTRELAAQVAESVKTYGRHLPLKSAVVYGGVNIRSQIMKLRRGVDILIATPGRLLDHVSQRTVDLRNVDMLVLDEADRMLDMGFIHDVKKIIKLLPPRKQTLLFSATLSNDIQKLADSLLKSPVMIEVAKENLASELVDQQIYPVDREKKRELLSHLITSNNWKQVLVFTRTKHGANRLSEQLEKDGIKTTAIHGNKSQGARMQALASFKNNKVRVLVATDIAARGLDINLLPHVVNFELPCVPEDYIHRIGRTGRAGMEGEAISLVCVDEKKLLRDIERLIKRDLPKVVVPGFEVNPSIRPQPIQIGRNRGFSRNNAKKGFSSRNRSNNSSSGGRSHAFPKRGNSNKRGNRQSQKRGMR
jgi:ATP-dependent RNA helicase RhlE